MQGNRCQRRTNQTQQRLMSMLEKDFESDCHGRETVYNSTVDDTSAYWHRASLYGCTLVSCCSGCDDEGPGQCWYGCCATVLEVAALLPNKAYVPLHGSVLSRHQTPISRHGLKRTAMIRRASWYSNVRLLLYPRG